MCRNIKKLFNIDTSVSMQEIEASSLQYVRKVSGCKAPTVMNQQAFELAVAKIARATFELLDSMEPKMSAKKALQSSDKSKKRSNTSSISVIGLN